MSNGFFGPGNAMDGFIDPARKSTSSQNMWSAWGDWAAPTASKASRNMWSAWGDWAAPGAAQAASIRSGQGVTAPKPHITRPGTVYDAGAVAKQEAEATRQANIRNTMALVSDRFQQYGLSSLGGKIVEYAKAGMSADEIGLRLRQTSEYQERFSGMATLAKQGRAMTEAQYIAQEQAYAHVLKASGLPSGFYDSYKDFARFIANDVSPQELADRAKVATDLVNSKDEAYLQAFKDYYGISKSDLAAYYLDEKRALPILQKQAAAAQLGGEATKSGLNIDSSFAEGLVDQSISQGTARDAFNRVSAEKPTLDILSAIDNVDVGTKDAVNAELSLDAGATQKVKGLASRDRARFSGSAGGTQALGTSVSGQF